MVTAVILMNVERPRLRSIADDLLAVPGIAKSTRSPGHTT
jgi:hypothetical protein